MGYRDDKKTRVKFWAGRIAREKGVFLADCPFKTDGPFKKAWVLGWKEADDHLAPRQVTEKEWDRRMKKKGEQLPRVDHFCNHFDASKCVCQGTCGCHYQGSIRNHRVRLIRTDHICTYEDPHEDWVVMVHGMLDTDTVCDDRYHCKECQEALKRGEDAFKEGEILTPHEVIEAYEKGRRCFHQNPSRKWRHLWK